MPYQPRHARHPDPSELPPAMTGLADLIQIIPGNDSPAREDQS